MRRVLVLTLACGGKVTSDERSKGQTVAMFEAMCSETAFCPTCSTFQRVTGKRTDERD